MQHFKQNHMKLNKLRERFKKLNNKKRQLHEQKTGDTDVANPLPIKPGWGPNLGNQGSQDPGDKLPLKGPKPIQKPDVVYKIVYIDPEPPSDLEVVDLPSGFCSGAPLDVAADQVQAAD